ncbi:MAG TPA: hypothetical protein VHN14_25955 [Kofleriaceae bacterium]|jgi:hypothetical protein|nr:hypothetical protein [Kofleriaceae bacterium]
MCSACCRDVAGDRRAPEPTELEERLRVVGQEARAVEHPARDAEIDKLKAKLAAAHPKK